MNGIRTFSRVDVMVLKRVSIRGVAPDHSSFSSWKVRIKAVQGFAAFLECAARGREAELLFRGLAYKRAIKEFYSQNNRYPRQPKELANDKDSSKRRFIRQLYKDPMTGGDFKFILGPEGAIMGVVSSSKDVPFKKVDFEKDLENLEKAKTYADWRFEAKSGSGAHQGNAPVSSPPQRLGGPL
jgi:hypothetical protein